MSPLMLNVCLDFMPWDFPRSHALVRSILVVALCFFAILCLSYVNGWILMGVLSFVSFLIWIKFFVYAACMPQIAIRPGTLS